MKTKQCFKCDAVLPIVNFYKHPYMADGHLNKCKACTRYDVRQNRVARLDYYQAYDRERSKKPQRLETLRKSQARHPEKQWARMTLHNAVARGKIVKQPCEQCGNPRTDAHHYDYTKPLEVAWLCRKHHMAVHRLTENT